MSYWDTSALVKLYATEPDSTVFENHVLNAASPVSTSRVALYEARATLRRKEAEGLLQPGGAATLYSKLLQDVGAGQVRLIELGPGLEPDYGYVLDTCYRGKPPISVRTLDALHLAAARALKETELVATDRRLRDAARSLGFSLFPA